MAASYWQDLMSKDTDKTVDQHKGRLIDVEIRKYLKTIGKRGGKRGWRNDRK